MFTDPLSNDPDAKYGRITRLRRLREHKAALVHAELQACLCQELLSGHAVHEHIFDLVIFDVAQCRLVHAERALTRVGRRIIQIVGYDCPRASGLLKKWINCAAQSCLLIDNRNIRKFGLVLRLCRWRSGCLRVGR